MKRRHAILCALLLAMGITAAAAGSGPASASTSTKPGNSKESSNAAPATASANAAPAGATQEEDLRSEGEKRFRSNCARCHAAPPKFAPRMMATIVRHMRVRANITDQDMRLVLRYMTE